ncbi:hypothetical protein G9A89_018645 [Geosiphon pyriformis]|nr:hypothetical protein G9A89_018645 [Geosiphon pyriformis]
MPTSISLKRIPEENFFYAFNLTNDNHNINELTINTFDLTRKKKKAKVDFILDLNKALTSTADNNEPPKAKVFKNPPKLKPSKIVQKSGAYSVVKNLMKIPAYITFGQLMTHPHNVTPLICKAQVAGYFIDLILNSESSITVIAKHFLEAIGRKIDELSTQSMTNVHGDKKKDLSIAKAVPIHINGISIKTDMEVSEAKEYTIITTLPVTKQNQKEQSDESDDDESDDEEDQKEQKETAKLTYTIFTNNGKPLDNVKADKEGSMPNTTIGNMVLVPGAGVINLCIPLVMNASPA